MPHPIFQSYPARVSLTADRARSTAAHDRAEMNDEHVTSTTMQATSSARPLADGGRKFDVAGYAASNGWAVRRGDPRERCQYRRNGAVFLGELFLCARACACHSDPESDEKARMWMQYHSTVASAVGYILSATTQFGNKLKLGSASFFTAS